MASSEDLYPSEVTSRQIGRLLSALNLMRNHEDSDLLLTSGGMEFPVHKIVLKASCPYFKAMFSSKMREASSDKVVLNDIPPAALNVILDYLYTGQIATLSEKELAIDVLKAAHLLQLTDLFDYCCPRLVEWLSLANFHEILKLAELYDLKDIVIQIQCYIIANISEAAFHPEFLSLSKEEIIDLLTFANDRAQIMEEVIMGTLNWLRHDLENREKLAGELFSFINAKYVTREFMKNLLEYEERTSSSTEISHRIKDLAIDVFYTLCEYHEMEEDATNTKSNSDLTLGITLVFFSKYRVETYLDPDTKCAAERTILCDTVQRLDLHTMTWQPPRKLPFSLYDGAAMCQYGENIYMVGGALASSYLYYNVASNVVNYVACSHFNGKADGFLFALDRFLFFVERSTEGLFTCVVRITPGTDNCYMELRIQRPPTGWFSKVFATMQSFYVVYAVNMAGQAPCTVVYNYEISSLTGLFELKSSNTIAYLPQGVEVSFAVASGDLVGLYEVSRHIERLHRESSTDHWITMPCNVSASHMHEVNTVFKSPDDPSSIVFVSTEEDNKLRTPNFIWKPESGAWIQRPAAKGKCVLPEGEKIQKVYFVR